MTHWKEHLLETIGSTQPEKDWQFLMTLQKEQAPWLSDDMLEQCVVESVIKLHRDHKLDWLYWEFKNIKNHSNDNSSIAA